MVRPFLLLVLFQMTADNSPSPAGLPRAFREVPRTGVIYVMSRAGKLGFDHDRDQWSNLGQGAPETTAFADAPDRLHQLQFGLDDHEYAPVAGMNELRDAVAELYNRRYRGGKASQYTRQNVAISAGGRLALTRLVAALGPTHMGHFLPDYTAYEELLSSFGTFVPIPILLEPETGYTFSAKQLEREILGRGISAVLLSNPCNPTGHLIKGPELQDWVDRARHYDCSLIFDEFYSHYVYDSGTSVSAAVHVDDVDKDPVIIVDGLTKNWRYPGLRVSWTVGPASVIDAVTSAGSFLDGGCSRPMQLLAMDLVKQELADQEAHAIQRAFKPKRQLMLDGLRKCGVRVELEPEGGFYCWGDLSELPESINTGSKLLEALLPRKVITVPGQFFDINPGKRRPDHACRFGSFTRFSFGPPEHELHLGLDRLAALVAEHRT